MATSSTNNFIIRHEHRDFYSDVQRNLPRIGDVGEESDKFKERAYKQFHNTEYHNLAEIQDSFIPVDPTAGTPGRENNRNFNRMEYDIYRNDGKDADTIKAEVNDKVQLNVKEISDTFKEHGWTLNNTSSAIGTEPIQQSDYDEKDIKN